MIRDIHVYPWRDYSKKNYLLTKIITEDASYSSITSLISDYSINRLTACQNAVSSIRKNISGIDESYWDSIEEMLEEIHESSGIDPGILLSISVSMAKAATADKLWMINKTRKSMRFPRIALSVIRGRVSASGSDWKSFILIPGKVRNPSDMQDQLLSIWSETGHSLSEKGALTGKDLDNRWITSMNTENTLEFISAIAEENDMKIGIDAGSWKREKNNIYNYKNEGRKLNENAHMEYVRDICNRFDIKYMGNPFFPGSFDMLTELKSSIKKDIMISVEYENDIRNMISLEPVSYLSLSPDMFYNLTDMNKFVRHIAEEKKLIFSAPRYSIQDRWFADAAISFNVPFMSATPLEGLSIMNRLTELWYDVPNEEI